MGDLSLDSLLQGITDTQELKEYIYKLNCNRGHFDGIDKNL